jgi:hypothetical protein
MLEDGFQRMLSLLQAVAKEALQMKDRSRRSVLLVWVYGALCKKHRSFYADDCSAGPPMVADTSELELGITVAATVATAPPATRCSAPIS